SYEYVFKLSLVRNVLTVERYRKCPKDVRQQFKQVAQHKYTVARDTHLENPMAQLYLIEKLNAVQQNMDLLGRDNQQNYTSENSTIMVENRGGNNEITDENSATWNKKTSENDTPTAAPATPQERTYCSKENGHKHSECYLINKMSEEDRLHKKASRKFAELELQRKQLEIQRSQWEFQRDKYQSEIRWAYDLRILQYREEQVKRSLICNM
ncbi:unnamed protein product, partial [Heterotrigona itama]